MKAITIWQPWASLLACGAKQYETRSWETNYRGTIAIHAAFDPHLKIWEELDDVTAGTMQGILDFIDPDELPLGSIIATAELVECWKILDSGKDEAILQIINAERQAQRKIYDNEIHFGDWTPGRYAWEFRNMTMLPEPIPAKGKQRIWNWEEGEQ